MLAVDFVNRLALRRRENCPLLALILIAMLSVYSSAAVISGTIRSLENNAPIVEANLGVEQSTLTARSDHSGRFSIVLPGSGEYRLRITHVSFEKMILDIIAGDRDTTINILLTPRTYISDEIVVTGTRTPYLLKDVPVTTEVIRTEDAIRTGATTVDQALKTAVGVNVDNNLSGAGVSLRGIDPTRVLVLVDGEKIVGRVRGAIDLSQISLANVEKIEVVKGVGSTLYGTDAIGGVVNIITRKPTSQLRLHSAAEYGSFKTYAQTAELEASPKDWGLQFGARFDRTDGFDLTDSDVETIGMERIKRFNLDGKIARQLSRPLRLTLNGYFYTENKLWIEADTAEGQRTYDDEENNYRYSGAAKLQYQPSPRTLIDFDAYGTYYDHLWTKDFIAWVVPKPFATQAERVDAVRTEDLLGEISTVATHSYSAGHVITMGGDVGYQSLTSEEVPDGKKSITSGDIYAQYEWKPLANLTTLPGIRLEEHSTYGDHINASVNVMYNPHPRFRIRAFHGGGFRAPSIKEIYFDFDHSAAGYRVGGGGEGLRPEKSLNSSLTLEYSYKGSGLHRITYFYNDIKDLIDFDLIDGEDPAYPLGIYEYTNVFRAYTKGIEWQSELKFNDHASASLSYTWLVAKNLDDGSWLLNRPEHSAKLLISYRIRALNATITAWGSYYSRKLWEPRNARNDFDAGVWAPSQHDINLSVVKSIGKQVELYARAENITDDVEVVYRYWPGRRLTAGLRWAFDRD